MPAPPTALTTPRSAAVVLLGAFVAVYAGDAGHGFIKDDFRWIRETRLESPADAPRLLTRTDGSYRPLVSLTFAILPVRQSRSTRFREKTPRSCGSVAVRSCV